MSPRRFDWAHPLVMLIAINLGITTAHADHLQGMDSNISNPHLVTKAILETDYSRMENSSAPQQWVDDRHHQAENHIDTWAMQIDDWFGEPDPNQPASAKVRAILDQSWSEDGGYRIKPRIRGSIKLPTLKKRWSVVFGDDNLEDEFQQAAHLRNTPMPLNDKEKLNNPKKDMSEQQSLALRLSKDSQRLGIDTDLDVGIRSGNDVYVRAKASKDWHIIDQHKLRLEQIVRYGSDSQTHARTNLEWRHQVFEQHFWANQLHIAYEDEHQDMGLRWGNSLFAEHSFFKNQRLNYGISASGSEKKEHLNSYGPFVSWRQPVLREWFFVQGDVNYQNDKDDNRGHEVGTFMRLEAIF